MFERVITTNILGKRKKKKFELMFKQLKTNLKYTSSISSKLEQLEMFTIFSVINMPSKLSHTLI